MKILCFKIYTGVSQATTYINQSCIAALRRLGHKVKVVDLKEAPDPIKEKMKFLGEQILKFKPDFIFTINNQGIIPPLIDHLKMPYASWFVDTPFGLKEEDASSYGALFLWEKGFIEELRGSNFRYIGHLPACTDPGIFKEIDISPEEQERYGCNISFVGNSFYSFYEKCHKEILKMDKEKDLRTLFEEIMKKKEEEPLKDVSQFLSDNDLFVSQRDSLEQILQGASVAISRKAVLEEVSEFGLSIYGDDGWKRLFTNGRALLHPCIDYCEELPRLYNATKINLNISTPQRRMSIPTRIFDVMACGRFVLTDSILGLEDFFEIEKEIVIYDSKGELRRKVEYFLAHPDECQEIARRAKRRILAEHTYRHRMEELIRIMEEIFRY